MSNQVAFQRDLHRKIHAICHDLGVLTPVGISDDHTFKRTYPEGEIYAQADFMTASCYVKWNKEVVYRLTAPARYEWDVSPQKITVYKPHIPYWEDKIEELVREALPRTLISEEKDKRWGTYDNHPDLNRNWE